VLGGASERLGDLHRSLRAPTGDKVSSQVGGKSGTTTARSAIDAGVTHVLGVPRVRELVATIGAPPTAAQLKVVQANGVRGGAAAAKALELGHERLPQTHQPGLTLK